MVDLIKIDAANLKLSLSLEERSYFALLGGLINDIMMNHKLMDAFANSYSNQHEDVINSYQCISLIINQIGRLYEAKELLRKVGGNSNLKKYFKDISTTGKECLKSFRSKVNSREYKEVRNRFSYHNDFSRIKETVDKCWDQYEYIAIYRGQDWYLTRFLFSDQLRTSAVLNIFGYHEFGDAKTFDLILISIVHNIVECTLDLQEYINEVINKMIEELDSSAIQVEPIENVPITKRSQLRMPFFVLNDIEPDKEKTE